MKGIGRPLRRSRQRDRILELLEHSESHPTALELYDQVKRTFPSASLGNVYRNLNILVEQGLIRRLGSGSTFDRFEAGHEAHAHWVCTQCGAIRDLELPKLTEVAERVASLGGTATEFRLNVYGLCPDCANRE
ncbi:MAG: Fur family transcriptional regulator [Spirochaetales bacterium]